MNNDNMSESSISSSVHDIFFMRTVEPERLKQLGTTQLKFKKLSRPRPNKAVSMH